MNILQTKVDMDEEVIRIVSNVNVKAKDKKKGCMRMQAKIEVLRTQTEKLPKYLALNFSRKNTNNFSKPYIAKFSRYIILLRKKLTRNIAKIFLSGAFGSENVEKYPNFLAVCGDFTFPLEGSPSYPATEVELPLKEIRKGRKLHQG